MQRRSFDLKKKQKRIVKITEFFKCMRTFRINVRFVQAVSRRQFIRSYQILYTASADIEDVQRRISSRIVKNY